MKNALKRRSVKFGLGLAVIIGLVAASYIYMNKPAEGSITNLQPSNHAAVEQQVSSSRYTGTAFSFDYPNDYGDLQKNEPSGTTVEQVSMVAHTGPTGTLRITASAKSSATASMHEDSAFQLRLRNATDYTHEATSVLGQAADKFSRKDKTEVIYFIPGPSYYAILAGT
jgi:hypothetical protein